MWSDFLTLVSQTRKSPHNNSHPVMFSPSQASRCHSNTLTMTETLSSRDSTLSYIFTFLCPQDNNQTLTP